MTSVGNDIVVLDEHAGRSADPLFHSKILSAGETFLHAQNSAHLPFDRFVWLCWAFKEAAYKALKRIFPESIFWAPKITITDIGPDVQPPGILRDNGQLEIGDPAADLQGFRAIARYNGLSIRAGALVGEGLIFAVAILGDDPASGDVYWGVRRIADSSHQSQSAEVRVFAEEKLRLFFPGQSLGFAKSEVGYPVVTTAAMVPDLPLSFSHHADLVAYAFIWPRELSFM